MCGRYSVLTEGEIVEIREAIQSASLQIAKDDFTGDYVKRGDEVRPTDHAPVIIWQGQGVVSFQDLRWGMKVWDGQAKPIINARVETLETTKTFAPLLTAGRCVVPTGHFFEWKKTGGKSVKHMITDREGNLLFMAGLYRETGQGREFAIITKDAQGDISEIHDRMPVILRADQIEDWLSGKLSPDDISKQYFNAAIVPCEGELNQLSLEDMTDTD